MKTAGRVLMALMLTAAPAWAQAGRDEAAMRELVRRLGDPDAKVRDRAEEELRGEGARAEKVLLEAKGDADAEVRLRVVRLLRELERRAKRERLRAVVDPPLLFLAPGDVPSEIHRADLKTGKAQKLFGSSTTITELKRDELTGRSAYYFQEGGLWILSPGAAEAEMVTTLQVRSPRGIAWSPAGDALALVSETDGVPALNLLTLASKELVRLTPDRQGHYEPSWSPDGRYLAYIRNDSLAARGADLYIMTAASPPVLERLTTDDAAKVSTAWSPDGRWIAFAWVNEPSLGIVSLADRKSPPRRIGSQGDDLAWSPDSSSLTYVRNIPDGAHELRIVDRDGKKDRVLVAGKGHKARPAWSPDGKRVAFDWDKDGHPQVYVVNADGSDLQQVTTLPKGACAPVWAPQE